MTRPIKITAAILVFAIMLSFGACKPRTGTKEQEQKGARENWEISENPRDEKPARKESSSEPESEPEKDMGALSLAEDFLNAARTGERYNIQGYADYNTLFGLREGQNADWVLKQILMRMRCEILSSDTKDDKAVVSVKFTNVDMGVVLPLYYSDAMHLEFKNAMSESPMEQNQLDTEYERMFAGLMVKHEAAKIEKIADIEVNKVDGIWKITTDNTVGNAMLGGYIDAQKAPMTELPQIEIPAQSNVSESKQTDFAEVDPAGDDSAIDEAMVYSDNDYDMDYTE